MISSEKADIKAFLFVRNPTKFVKKEKLKKNNWKGLHFRLAADIIFL